MGLDSQQWLSFFINKEMEEKWTPHNNQKLIMYDSRKVTVSSNGRYSVALSSGYQQSTIHSHPTITGTLRGIIRAMAATKKKQPTKKQFFDVLKQVARKQQPAAAPKKKKRAAK